ncbi:MAG: alkaline phosphatase family protein [Acidobacteriota bacterium]
MRASKLIEPEPLRQCHVLGGRCDGRRWLSLFLMAPLLTLLVAAAACGGDRAGGKRVIVLGIDGMDYALTQRLISEGRLPNLQRLAESGGFSPLGTSVPPQSPVAWSDFITGLYDYIHRQPQTMLPYLSTTRTENPNRNVELFGWKLPLSSGKVELLRHGVAFWQVLEANGIPTTVIRMPANFPPSGSAERELSGMGTPDILGTPGNYSFFTTDPGRITEVVTGGKVYPADVVDGVFHGKLMGPDNPFRVESQPVSADFTVYIGGQRPVAKIVLGDQEVILQQGEWSDWIAVEFELVPHLQTLRGVCRFYLKEVRPDFELYVTPINVDPTDPAMPISTPGSYAEELSEVTGRFYTQGMPEDTKALSEGVFNDDDFLRQASLAAEENRRQYDYVLDHFEDGLLFYYFGNLDQVSHMMWRAMDPTHPAHDPVADLPYRHAVEDLYVDADEIVGKTLEKMGENTTLIVMSDHGFTSWKRAFNLNTWLWKNGYITLLDPSRVGEMEYFGNVDWSRTRAYALGLNGLYLNIRGRERLGIVASAQRQALMDEIAQELESFVDPKTGELAVERVYKREQIYQDRGELEIGPDLIVGYAKGVRSSNESALGEFSREIVVDNTDKWSGDHCMAADLVPGVLLSNRPLRRPAPSLKQLAAAVLAEFGIEGFPPAAEEAVAAEAAAGQ